jgi:mRNA interferase RelE/StbE
MIERVLDVIRGLQRDPFLSGIKKLQDRFEYKIRVGDYRILFEVDPQVLLVGVMAVVHRRSAYR